MRPHRSRLSIGPEGPVRVLVTAHLAEEAAVLPKVEAVVRREDNRSLFSEAHVLDGLQQVTQPRVDHSDLTAVGGVTLTHLVFGVSRHVVPVPVQRQHLFAVVAGPVEIRVVGRRVPGLVGIPGVDVEEEVLLVVLLQPPDGGRKGARRVSVRFVSPCSADVQGFVVIAGLREYRPQGVLSPVHEEGLEPPVIVHPVPQVVWCVHRRRRVQTALGQHLRQCGHALRQGRPTHEGHCPATRLVVCSGGHGGESAGVVPVEPYRPGRQRIEGWRSNRWVAVCAYVVSTEGVSNYPDDVHPLRSCDG